LGVLGFTFWDTVCRLNDKFVYKVSVVEFTWRKRGRLTDEESALGGHCGFDALQNLDTIIITPIVPVQ
jgi:hypothetical protein